MRFFEFTGGGVQSPATARIGKFGKIKLGAANLHHQFTGAGPQWKPALDNQGNLTTQMQQSKKEVAARHKEIQDQIRALQQELQQLRTGGM
jgi:tRNA G26 N,N-dimethylase Trm1